MHSATFEVTGMSCGHCVRRVEQALRELPGVEVRNVAVGSAEVAFDPGAASPAAIVSALERAGYPATEVNDRPAAKPRFGG